MGPAWTQPGFLNTGQGLCGSTQHSPEGLLLVPKLLLRVLVCLRSLVCWETASVWLYRPRCAFVGSDEAPRSALVGSQDPGFPELPSGRRTGTPCKHICPQRALSSPKAGPRAPRTAAPVGSPRQGHTYRRALGGLGWAGRVRGSSCRGELSGSVGVWGSPAERS